MGYLGGMAAPVHGGVEHLPGLRLPDLSLPSTAGRRVVLSNLTARTVLFVYPMTGRPGVPLPDDWDLIPGARGCTPEACRFRDLHADFRAADADVYGLSSQSTEYQREAVERLNLPFALLADERLQVAEALRLPTFSAGGRRLYTRLTLVVRDGVIEHVFHPVPVPGEHADHVLSWLIERPERLEP